MKFLLSLNQHMLTHQILDGKTGNLKLADGFVILQQTKPEQIISCFTKENVEIRDMHNSWKHYSISTIKVNDTYLSMIFYFDNDCLKSLQFIVSNEVITRGSWDDWSKEKELNKRDYYDQWLTNQIGKARQFTWGKVAAFYDSKGGRSSIVLEYN